MRANRSCCARICESAQDENGRNSPALEHASHPLAQVSKQPIRVHRALISLPLSSPVRTLTSLSIFVVSAFQPTPSKKRYRPAPISVVLTVDSFGSACSQPQLSYQSARWRDMHLLADSASRISCLPEARMVSHSRDKSLYRLILWR